MRHAFKTLTGVLFCLVALGCGAPDETPAFGTPQDLALLTTDTVELAATLYPPARKNPPGLILVHDRLGSRAHFAAFAARAQREGYLSIAVDLRGHGGSVPRNGTSLNPRAFAQDDWMRCLSDLESAKKTLLERGADPDNLAMVGAGLGANLVLQYASRDEEIQAIVLLSPGLSYEGIEAEEALARYGKRPTLLVTSTGDSYAASTCEELHAKASSHCELREYDGAAHGVDLLDAVEICPPQIFLWLEGILGNGADREESGTR
ncbi:MAG: alpha/beta fold hydrolase [Candidatus Hydrogenedentes bacterium]|nr:alpha/beta fold hydrolase [Candidatus Hydrogenedentota bacterium]